MKPASRIADQLGKPMLDMHVDVFQRRVLMELACLELGGNL